MSSEDELDFSFLGDVVKDRIYAKDAAEVERHVIAREVFLRLYVNEPKVRALLYRLVRQEVTRLANDAPGVDLDDREQLELWDAQADRVGEEVGGEIAAFVRELGPYFPWLLHELCLVVFQLVTAFLFGDDAAELVTETTNLPIEIEPFRSCPGESLENQAARWNEHKEQVDKHLALARGRVDKRSETAVQRDVRWYFENEYAPGAKHQRYRPRVHARV